MYFITKIQGRGTVMKYIKISAFDCPDAWYKALEAIWAKGEVYEVCYGSEKAKTKKLNLSIEIIKPEEFKMKKASIENFINDLQARLHQVDMIVKKQKNENEFLKKNLNTAVSNIILISLASGNINKEKLSNITGISEKELDIFLDKLIKDNKIKKENELYALIK